MGAAYFIVLERKIDGLDTMIDGKLLARTSEVLDAIAPQLGVRPISEFISIDPAQAAEFMDGDVGDIELPPLQQFSGTGRFADGESHVVTTGGTASDSRFARLRAYLECSGRARSR